MASVYDITSGISVAQAAMINISAQITIAQTGDRSAQSVVTSAWAELTSVESAIHSSIAQFPKFSDAALSAASEIHSVWNAIPSIDPASASEITNGNVTNIQNAIRNNQDLLASNQRTIANIISPTSSTQAITTTSGSSTTTPTISNNITAPQATSPSLEPSNSRNDETFGAGAIAGIAVGCAIGGALIAGLIVWAILAARRRKAALSLQRENEASGSASGTAAQQYLVASKSEDPALAAGAGAGSGAAAMSPAYLRSILPEIPEDSEVKQKTFEILDGASIHVANFYSATPVLISSDDAKPKVNSFSSPHMPGALWGLLVKTQSTGPLISRALSEAIVNSISPVTGQEARTLLPGGLMAAFAASETASKDVKAHTFEWRMLTMHLYNQGANLSENKTARDALVLELSRDFQTAFAPWRRSNYTAEQEKQALIGLFNAAADYGVWLLSQRSTFIFQWQRDLPVGMIETRPALLKTADAFGKPLDRAQTILESETKKT